LKNLKKNNIDFEQIAILINDARNRAFHKVNEELVLLYLKVGKIVSDKVLQGVWGDSTVDELAKYISVKMPNLSGYNRRGIYKMKQFQETYAISSDCFKIWIKTQIEIETNSMILSFTYLK
jgi:hypothetical protein